MRDQTGAAHSRLDAMLDPLDLADPHDYRRFLLVHAHAFLSTEAALDRAGAADAGIDWNERHRADALGADCQGLGVSVPRVPATPMPSDRASVLGTVYVLEGSRLGGAVLAKRAERGADPLVRDNLRFLRHGAGQRLWPRLLPHLTALNENDAGRAAAAALAVFGRFEAAARAEGLGERTEGLGEAEPNGAAR